MRAERRSRDLPLDKVLLRKGNCVPAAMARLVPPPADVLRELNKIDNAENREAEERSSRSVRSVRDMWRTNLHPIVGLHVGEGKGTLIVGEHLGVPHCVAARVTEEDPTQVDVWDDMTCYRMSLDALSAAAADATDRKTLVSFVVVDTDAGCPGEGKSERSAADRLLDLHAGATSVSSSSSYSSIVDTAGPEGVRGFSLIGGTAPHEARPFYSELVRGACVDGILPNAQTGECVTYRAEDTGDFLSVFLFPFMLWNEALAPPLDGPSPFAAVLDLTMTPDRVRLVASRIEHYARIGCPMLCMLADVEGSSVPRAVVMQMMRGLCDAGAHCVLCHTSPPSWSTLALGHTGLMNDEATHPWVDRRRLQRLVAVDMASPMWDDLWYDRPASLNTLRGLPLVLAPPAPAAALIRITADVLAWDLQAIGVDGIRGLARRRCFDDGFLRRVGSHGAVAAPLAFPFAGKGCATRYATSKSSRRSTAGIQSQARWRRPRRRGRSRRFAFLRAGIVRS